MPKKITKSEFERMLDKLFDEHEKQLLSERIKGGIKQVKAKKSRKHS